MNYKFYLDRQLKIYAFMVLIWIASYGTTLYFTKAQPKVLTSDLCASILSASLTFIFFGAYLASKQNLFNTGLRQN